jgi:gluconate:H+ symporter, GntP family
MASDPVRIAVVVIAILALIVLITKFRIHPFIALILASWFLGIACGLPPTEVIKHFEKGFGDVLSFVGIVIGLGAMLGGILISSGGADVLANDLIALGGKKWIPWTMFVASLLIGLPLFFEVGFVLLVPLAFVISKRMDTPILRVGLPMLAGLSVAHALVPPHPAPTLAVATFHADAGKTILYAILVGIPTGILAGPIFANFAAGWVHSGSAAGALFPGPESAEEENKRTQARSTAAPGPTLAAVLTTILLPPVLMMSRSLADAFLPGPSFLKGLIDFVGDPIAALLIALFFGMYALELRRGLSMDRLDGILNKSLGAIAAVVLIVGAGGGFKEMLIATKISELIGQWATQAHISPLFLGWAAAAVVRIATGSATVATITGAGIMAPIVIGNPAVSKELMVLAVGSGSIILSHVNDAGFWLVKEYFRLSLPDTFKSWTLMETLLSVLGLTFVLLLSLVVH